MGIYEKLRGLSKEDAVVKYLKVATSQPNYGFSFFPGIVRPAPILRPMASG